jgi:hypothetical protein
MAQIDRFIDTAIARLSSEDAPMLSHFYVDLRTLTPERQRITDKFVDQSISLCNSRGIQAERSGDGLTITIHLNSCYLNPTQSANFNIALDYTRSQHGNHL